MRYHVLASDYDGTLAHDGRVDDSTIKALEKLLATGRRLVLVTGRELPDLLDIFPKINLFEQVVAENGALLYNPATREVKTLAEPPPPRFVEELRKRQVGPIAVGRVIVATWQPHENTVLEVIRDLGLELQVVFNKGAVMILPAGVNKATGLAAALKEMGLAAHNAVGIGDAENDHALLRMCERSVAVANALPAVKETADIVTRADHGAGVVELIEKLIATDLDETGGRPERHALPIGTADENEITIPPYGPCILITGPSASGKSTVATGILEAIAGANYQFCIIDPEGDYETLEGAVLVGGPTGPPVAEEAMALLQNPADNLVISLTGMPIADRPPFFLNLLPKLLQLRARTGRPHWLILDETHHLMPSEWKPPTGLLPQPWHNAIFITVHPELLAAPLLERVGTLMFVGQDAADALRKFAELVGDMLPEFEAPALKRGEMLMWSRDGGTTPLRVKARPSQADRKRHRRKYAEGKLPPERCFYFRGPEGKLNLQVHNLMMFMQVGDGVDDDTWDYHLRNGDYARWFRESIQDENLASEVEHIANAPKTKAKETRALVRTAIERDYTLPASAPLPVPGTRESPK